MRGRLGEEVRGRHRDEETNDLTILHPAPCIF